MSSDPHIFNELPAYALEALEPEEKQQVDKHLRACAACRQELEAYQNLSGQLGMALVDVDPPAGLKARVMAEVETRTPTGRQEPGRVRRKDRLPFWRQAPAWAVVGALLVLVLLASNLLLLQRLSRLEGADPPPLPYIKLSSTDNAPGAQAVLVMSDDRRMGTLVVDGLAPLDNQQQYQLWLISNGERTSGGVFSVGPQGYGVLWVNSPEPLLDYDSFGVTIEPYGGSPGPTGLRVLAGEVES